MEEKLIEDWKGEKQKKEEIWNEKESTCSKTDSDAF